MNTQGNNEGFTNPNETKKNYWFWDSPQLVNDEFSVIIDQEAQPAELISKKYLPRISERLGIDQCWFVFKFKGQIYQTKGFEFIVSGF